MNILLIGNMGSGKSSIGMALAKILHMKFVELDDLVLRHTGFPTVEQVYAHRKSLWKECELEISKDLSVEDNNIIACGGGFIENELNVTYFTEHSPDLRIFYIHARPEIVAKRIHALSPGKKFKDVLLQTQNLYAKRDILCRMHANHIIENEKREVYESAGKIAKLAWDLAE